MCSSLLRQSQGRLGTDSQMIAAHEVDFCLLDHIPNTRLFQMIEFVVVCSSQFSAETPVLVCDDDPATP